MALLLLAGALIFPPAFILWRPRTPARPGVTKVRVAGAVVVVWMLSILWAVPGAMTGQAGDDVYLEQRVTTKPATGPAESIDETWLADAPPETSLALMLGWVPGAVYAGLLLLVRRAIEGPGSWRSSARAGRRQATRPLRSVLAW